MDLPQAFEASILKGASEHEAGQAGYVPAPQAGDHLKFLRGDGTWATIETNLNTQVFEIEISHNQDHLNAIQQFLGEHSPNNGDIAIIKEQIVEGKYQYTAYVYNEHWKAMDGNYSATSIYTNEDIVVTTDVGELTVNSTIEAGTNLNDLLVSMLSQSKEPEIVKSPSVTLTVTNNGKGTSFEAGTTIVPKWSASFDSGSYSYKSTKSQEEIIPVDGTGVEATTWSVKLGNVEIGTSQTGSGEAVVLEDSNLTYTVTVKYSDGNYALTNLNKLPKNEVQIQGASITSSGASISTYRKMYAGAIGKDKAINNANLRELLTTSGKQASTSGNYEFTAKTGDEKLIFIYPQALTSKTPKFEYFTMSWETFDGFNVLEDYVEVSDFRGGENGLKDYVVYVYEPAGAFKADTKYRVSF